VLKTLIFHFRIMLWLWLVMTMTCYDYDLLWLWLVMTMLWLWLVMTMLWLWLVMTMYSHNIILKWKIRVFSTYKNMFIKDLFIFNIQQRRLLSCWQFIDNTPTILLNRSFHKNTFSQINLYKLSFMYSEKKTPIFSFYSHHLLLITVSLDFSPIF
jgi:hypothetical protein